MKKNQNPDLSQKEKRVRLGLDLLVEIAIRMVQDQKRAASMASDTNSKITN